MQRLVKGIPVNYQEYGSGRAVLMIHSSPLDHHHMISDMEPMFDDRSGWRRLYIDLPGHGKTPGADWLRSLDDFLDLLVSFMDEVAPKERFSVIGTSFGGLLARGLTHRCGTRMDGLMLVAPTITLDTARQIAPPFQRLHEDPAFTAALEPDEAWINEIVVAQNPTIPLQMRVSKQALMEADHEFISHMTRTFSFDLDSLEPPLAAPALIVTGRQDSVVGYEQAFGMLKHYPRATYAVLDRAGHVLALEQKPLFRMLANEWLDRVEEAIRKR